MNAKIILLPGDGAGPEVVAEARRVLGAVAEHYGHGFTFEEHLIGGSAIDATGDPLPSDTLSACLEADAVLLGAVGGPKWADPTAAVRPEQGLLGIRKEMGLFANLRPVRIHPELADASPLRADRLEGVDLVIVRELTGGIYFGNRQEAAPAADGEQAAAYDTMSYNESEVRRIAHVAFDLARTRGGRVMSVDKANVLASSRLWRRVVADVASEYPEVPCDTMLVDAAAMHLLRRPSDFDVVLTSNMFGDILADEASMLAGSMGLLPSASLGEVIEGKPFPRAGLYEPIHGSAPDIAGQGIVNPLATILSAAMLLRHSLGLVDEAEAVERAVETTLRDGLRTVDLAERAVEANRPGEAGSVGDEDEIASASGSAVQANVMVVGTADMGEAVVRRLPVTTATQQESVSLTPTLPERAHASLPAKEAIAARRAADV